jgi:hemolysin activation/secretion protein
MRPSDAPVLPEGTPPKVAPPPETKVTVNVKAFRIAGNTVFSSEELHQQVLEFVGLGLDVGSLYEAAARLQHYYRERGYFLAVAYLPPQEIHDGVVQIAVLEGRLGSVSLQSEAPLKLRESFARRVLDVHLKPGEVVTEKALERPLLLLRDLPVIELSSELGPSRDQIGAADLTVKISENRRRSSGHVDIDNHGNRFTGEYRVGVDINKDNLLGYGDLLSFRAFVSHADMRFGRLSYVIPAGPYGTRVGASYSGFSYALGEDFEALEANGEGTVLAIYGLHPVLRTRTANLFVRAGIEAKTLEDRVDSVGLSEARDIRAGNFGLIGDFGDRFFSGGINSYAVTYTRGDLDLESPELRAIDAFPGIGPQTAGTFSKWNVELRRLQRITDQYNLLMVYSGQLATKNLTAAEKMSLGGPNGVRAFPVGEAPGDTGQLFSGELRYIVPGVEMFGGNLTATAYYDYGQVQALEDPPPAVPTAGNKRTLSSYGLGLALGREGNFLMRVNLAKPLKGTPATSDTKERDPRAWFQALKRF